MCRKVFDGVGVHPIRHHYYSPLVYPSDVPTSLDRERVIEGLDLNEAGQLALLAELRYRDELLAIPRQAFDFANTMFGPGDSEYLYGMIRQFKPRQVIEIGSGESTRIARLAIEANGKPCRHTCIEPFEAHWLKSLGVEVIRAKVETLPPSFVDDLADGDILFIDSSHVIRPQGDVTFEYLTLLGRLKPGVLVHIHDIRTPRDYLERWVLADRRMWNEQYLLEAFLCFNRAFEVVAAVNWLSHNHRGKMDQACPVLPTQPSAEPGSFWIRRV